MIVEPDLKLAALCVCMVALTAAWYRVAQVGPPSVAPRAAARGAVQLGVVALVLAAALSHLWSAVLVLAVMFAAAVATAAQRCCAGWSGMWLTLALGAGIGTVLPLMLITGVVPLTGVAVVPIGGIVLGGTMTATSLAARRALDTVELRRGEVEAAMSLGFTEREARLGVIRPSAGDALLPGVDQTRTVGLVTLPGAFVGVLLTSGSALQAAAVQMLILTGLLLAQVTAVAVTTELIARSKVHRTPQ
ncbi:ABC transporter permease [Nocardia beijingensis]|uniref:ABC transporter permease n=1 Tax=Nocardia beijingensis TaxID=95162 RepID=UPI00339EE043